MFFFTGAWLLSDLPHMTKFFITDSRKIGKSDRENRKLIGGSGRKLQRNLQNLVNDRSLTLISCFSSTNFYLTYLLTYGALFEQKFTCKKSLKQLNTWIPIVDRKLQSIEKFDQKFQSIEKLDRKSHQKLYTRDQVFDIKRQIFGTGPLNPPLGIIEISTLVTIQHQDHDIAT